MSGTATCDLGCGLVFKLAPQGAGWNFAPLYKFSGPSDGKSPIARVVFGPDGRLYGTTFLGGNSPVSGGTVFALAPPPTVCRASCSWVKTTLWSFGQNQDNDGLRPGYGDLVFDSAGNIYGTTQEGGATRRLAPWAAARCTCCRTRGDMERDLDLSICREARATTRMPESRSMPGQSVRHDLFGRLGGRGPGLRVSCVRGDRGRRRFSTTSRPTRMAASPAPA